MEKKALELQAVMRGTVSMNLYEVSFEDKKNPSENGLGFSTMVAAPNKEVARNIFLSDEPDCEIREVVARDGVVIPLMGISEGMTLNAYQAKAMTTCLPTSHNDAYMLTNLVGEVGELSSKIAKAIRKGIMQFDGDGNLLFTKEYLDGKHDDVCSDVMTGIVGELGDVLWQLSGLCTTLGYDLNQISQYNLDKLAARKQAGTIDGNGDGVSAEDGRK